MVKIKTNVRRKNPVKRTSLVHMYSYCPNSLGDLLIHVQPLLAVCSRLSKCKCVISRNRVPEIFWTNKGQMWFFGLSAFLSRVTMPVPSLPSWESPELFMRKTEEPGLCFEWYQGFICMFCHHGYLCYICPVWEDFFSYVLGMKWSASLCNHGYIHHCSLLCFTGAFRYYLRALF
jgi:hypothetical protein